MSTRRTQAERTADTRARLMEAALVCLCRDGYAAASTTAIAREAGVSRGAQTHHFPARSDLMLAAVEHVAQQRRDAFEALMATLPPGPTRLPQAIRYLWQALRADSNVAWLELAVASRTDPELREAFLSATTRLRAEMQATLARSIGDGPSIDPAAVEFAAALLEGLALHVLTGMDPDRAERVVDLLAHLNPLVLANPDLVPGGR